MTIVPHCLFTSTGYLLYRLFRNWDYNHNYRSCRGLAPTKHGNFST
jgi:hypothetical protein